MLGISRKIRRKPRKAVSFRATAPNQAWHADVTIITTLDGIKHDCYLVVDNFSRKVLAWRVSGELSASIRVATLREAAKPLIAASPDSGEVRHTGSIDLIVDGGSENNNSTVEGFISDSTISIHKLVALQMAVSDAITDYNDRRPHGSLDGLTPSEPYRGIGSETLRASERLKTAQRERIQNNPRKRCQLCKN